MLKSIHTRHNEVLLVMLRSSREARRLRQADLAVRLGQGQGTISKIERGERRLDILELRAWLLALEVDFQSFMVELHQRLEGMTIPDAMLRTRRGSRVHCNDRSVIIHRLSDRLKEDGHRS